LTIKLKDKMIFNICLFISFFTFIVNAKKSLFLHDVLVKYQECTNYYIKNIQPLHSKHKNVTFEEYLEYWWDTEETANSLLNRICKKMMRKLK
jgi:hypothetical protein